MVDLGSDDGIEPCQDVLDRLGADQDPAGGQVVAGRGRRGTVLHADVPGAQQDRRPGAAERLELLHELLPLDFPEYVISAQDGTGLEALRQADLPVAGRGPRLLKLPRPRSPTATAPSPSAAAARAGDGGHGSQGFSQGLKFARVWGEAVHDGTLVKGDYVLHDQDIVELHCRGKGMPMCGFSAELGATMGQRRRGL